MKKLALATIFAATLSGCAGMTTHAVGVDQPVSNLCLVQNDNLFATDFENELISELQRHTHVTPTTSIGEAKDTCDHYAVVRARISVDGFEFLSGMNVTVYTKQGHMIGTSEFTVPNNANLGKFSSSGRIGELVDNLFN